VAVGRPQIAVGQRLGYQFIAARAEQVDDRLVRAADRVQRGLHDQRQHLVEVQRARQRLADRRQRLGLAQLPLQVVVQFGGIDRHGGHRAEHAEDVQVCGPEGRHVVAGDGQRADHPVAQHQWHAEHGAQPACRRRRLGQSGARLAARDVGDVQRLGMFGDPRQVAHAERVAVGVGQMRRLGRRNDVRLARHGIDERDFGERRAQQRKRALQHADQRAAQVGLLAHIQTPGNRLGNRVDRRGRVKSGGRGRPGGVEHGWGMAGRC